MIKAASLRLVLCLTMPAVSIAIVSWSDGSGAAGRPRDPGRVVADAGQPGAGEYASLLDGGGSDATPGSRPVRGGSGLGLLGVSAFGLLLPRWPRPRARARRHGPRAFRSRAEFLEARELLTTYTLFGTSSVPQFAVASDPNAIELGVRFTSDVSGSVSAVRFYKGSGVSGEHDVHVWTSAGTLLSTGTYVASGSDVGWETVPLPSPVVLTAGVTYVASYDSPPGGYAVTWGGLSSGVDSGPLHVAPSGTVYRYGTGSFPDQGPLTSNYWVDVVFTPSSVAPSSTIYVDTSAQLQQAINNAAPGTQILVEPGTYQGDLGAYHLQGTATQPIVIAAADPSNPPVIQGGTSVGIYFNNPSYLRLSNLVFDGDSTGLNLDDGGNYGSAHDIVLSGLVVRNMSYVGIKMAGVDNFQIVNTVVDNWYGAGGVGIDMVGCHNGSVSGSTLTDTDGQPSYGIQMKGGSANIDVRDSLFQHAGVRAIQIGGATAQGYFRPSFQGYEATNITVEGNVIVGSQAAVTFAGVDGAVVRYNTIYRPTTWDFRILQEEMYPGYIPSRDGVVTDNVIAFRSDEVSTAVDVGPYTAPETFPFAGNWWYALDNPSLSQPALPTAEVGGTYGVDPQFVNAEGGDFHLKAPSPAASKGAYAPRS